MNSYSILSGLLLLVLCFHNLYYGEVGDVPRLNNLVENPDLFEGKDIRLLEGEVTDVGEGYFEFSKYDRKVRVAWDGKVEIGETVTVKGVSKIVGEGLVKAEEVHVHRYIPLIFASSFIALLFFLKLFRREWRFNTKSFWWEER
ncbi:MAG: hypothetical protein ABH950_03530 [Candidatus Altiarchaeota archaeon]